MDRIYLEKIRLAELDFVVKKYRDIFLQSSSILEIGAGSGWQARELASRGYDVQAVDIAASTYSAENIFPVQQYDGEHLPFVDASFDIIFSSNVLEHVDNLKSLLQEMHRVLKNGGKCIHLVPTAQWRIWTSLAHYGYMIKFIGMKLISSKPIEGNASSHVQPDGLKYHWWRYIIPIRHGERGNFLTETYYFSKTYWKSVFSSSLWNILLNDKNELFYTGYGIFDYPSSIPLRKMASKYLGSACHVFILEKKAWSYESSKTIR